MIYSNRVLAVDKKQSLSYDSFYCDSPSIHFATIASIGRHQDAHYVGAYSLLTSAIGQAINPFGLVSSALFYIACGRYGISVKEFDYFQMQNSMQNPTQY